MSQLAKYGFESAFQEQHVSECRRGLVRRLFCYMTRFKHKSPRFKYQVLASNTKALCPNAAALGLRMMLRLKDLWLPRVQDSKTKQKSAVIEYPETHRKDEGRLASVQQHPPSSQSIALVMYGNLRVNK
jgi:hypothetical protein